MISIIIEISSGRGVDMDYIIRPKYIDKIKKFIDKPIIKVISGMRRVGKSTLLTIIKDELLKDIPEKNKIYLNFESSDLFIVQNHIDFMDHLKPLVSGLQGRIYFFFDEVQIVSGFEKVVNALMVDYDCDIYITGSNSTLISGDLATLLTGRYIEFDIQPFTFSEFIEVNKHHDMSRDDLFYKYISVGGMPFLKHFDMQEQSAYEYLEDVYNTVLIKDVIEYNRIRDVAVFNRIILYVLENIGHTFSANSIKKYLKNENINVSVDTVLNYLDYSSNAFIIKKVPRYDAIGKRLLKVDEKYYLTDHGFRAAKGFSNTRDIERCLENIVCIELLSRGYDVKIGKVMDREIDFIAIREGKKSYYQVSYLLSDESTRNREFGVYDSITDNYPKYVLSMDKMDFSSNGVIHKNVIDFLLET